MNYASKDLDQAISLYLLSGWKFLWRTTGTRHDAYMACVTDGVTRRIISAAGEVREDREVRYDRQSLSDVPFCGPARPRPGHYPSGDVLEVFGLESDQIDSIPASPHYVPWRDVFLHAEALPQYMDSYRCHEGE